MDIFHTKECEICNQKIADADFTTHLKDCKEGETWVVGEGDVEHNKEDRMVVTSGECVSLSEWIRMDKSWNLLVPICTCCWQFFLLLLWLYLG